MNNKKRSYIKHIEAHFLRVSGKGLMLSSKDYELIDRWYNTSVSQETILKGISLAFSNNPESEIRSLFQIRNTIEEIIKTSVNNNDNIFENAPTGSSTKNFKYLNRLLENTDKLIKKENRTNVKHLYIKNKKNLLGLLEAKNNFFSNLEKLEENFFNELFESLKPNEKKEVLDHAYSQIPDDAKFLNKRVEVKTINSFRNDYLLSYLKITNIFKI